MLVWNYTQNASRGAAPASPPGHRDGACFAMFGPADADADDSAARSVLTRPPVLIYSARRFRGSPNDARSSAGGGRVAARHRPRPTAHGKPRVQRPLTRATAPFTCATPAPGPPAPKHSSSGAAPTGPRRPAALQGTATQRAPTRRVDLSGSHAAPAPALPAPSMARTRLYSTLCTPARRRPEHHRADRERTSARLHRFCCPSSRESEARCSSLPLNGCADGRATADTLCAAAASLAAAIRVQHNRAFTRFVQPHGSIRRDPRSRRRRELAAGACGRGGAGVGADPPPFAGADRARQRNLRAAGCPRAAGAGRPRRAGQATTRGARTGRAPVARRASRGPRETSPDEPPSPSLRAGRSPTSPEESPRARGQLAAKQRVEEKPRRRIAVPDNTPAGPAARVPRYAPLPAVPPFSPTRESALPGAAPPTPQL